MLEDAPLGRIGMTTLQENEDGLAEEDAARIARVRTALDGRSIVMVGLMGAGKSTIGRRLAQRLGLPFVDADNAIEEAAAMSIAEIFANYGEAHFRDGERRVVARLLQDEPRVLATGGGAFVNGQTRALVAELGLSVWLKADLDVLMKRVRRRANRPLLNADDPEGVMRRLMAERYPIYAQADVTVETSNAPHHAVVEETLCALERHFGLAVPAPAEAAESGS